MVDDTSYNLVQKIFAFEQREFQSRKTFSCQESLHPFAQSQSKRYLALTSFDRSLSAAKWLRQIVDGRETVAMLSAKHGRSIRYINVTISLAFLAPLLVTAAVEGRIPRGVSVRA